MQKFGERIEITEVKRNNMILKEIVEKLNLKVFCGEEFLEREVNGAYVSDLLSDVMGGSSEGQIWITLQSHLNVVAIGSLKELSAILLVKDIVPEPNVVSKALEEEIPILGTLESTFEIAGKLYAELN